MGSPPGATGRAREEWSDAERHRYAETHKLRGIVLVATYYTDLGDETEREGGWFDREWRWADIKANCGFIVQLADETDHVVPIAEGRFVRDQLQPVYVEVQGRRHFISKKGADVLHAVLDVLKLRCD